MSRGKAWAISPTSPETDAQQGMLQVLLGSSLVSSQMGSKALKQKQEWFVGAASTTPSVPHQHFLHKGVFPLPLSCSRTTKFIQNPAFVSQGADR